MEEKEPLSITIIEDQEDNIELLRILLQEMPFSLQVTHVGRNTKEAIDILRREEFDLALVDIQLGDGTIFDALQQVQASKNLAAKLIFITAHGTFENALKAIRLSCLDFITKPIDYQELKTAILKTINPSYLNPNSEQINMLMQLIQQDVATPEHIGILLTKGLIEFVATADISHISADINMASIHLNDGKILRSTKNLGYFISVLNTHHHFFQIHKSTLINIAYIQKYDPRERYVFLKDGNQLLVARRQSILLRERLLKL